MINFFDKNLAIIKKRYFMLYQELRLLCNHTGRFEIISCKDGNKTVRVNNSDGSRTFLHSRFDPIKEAVTFAEENFSAQASLNILFGFGLGYHVMEAYKKLAGNNLLFVFDVNMDIFKEALGFIDLTDLLADERVHLCLSGDVNQVLDGMKEVLSLNQDKKIIMHVPSVQAVPKEFEEFKFVLEDWNLRKSVSDNYYRLLEENSRFNIKNIQKNIGVLFNRFQGIPIIIVSAGPSLEKNMRLLKKAKNRALVICAGKALIPLLKNEIEPDFFVMVDPSEEIAKQIEGLENLNIPGIYLLTAAKKSAHEYKGPKFIAVHEAGYLKKGEENYIVTPGGSTATASLDIALKMGGGPILFVGQDLANTGNKHHVSGALNETDTSVKVLKNMRTVKGIHNETLYTTIGMLSFKRWIEKRIDEEKGITFINATEGGAKIEGAKHIPLEKAIYAYLTREYDFKEMIAPYINNEAVIIP
ncbi:MAG: DUF115 domain-containing protein [Clostridia bacterium]|nr:DUF115 domain-containing protein [Clostridia bacterium]